MTQITLLDGGMGQELVHRAGDKPTPLWSTQIMIDHPGMVEEIHRDFNNAGATIATTNSYAIHHDRLVGTDLEAKFEDLHMKAVSEAKQSGAGRIAGAVGPLGASYRVDVMPPYDEAVRKYAEVVSMISPQVDLIICETVVSVEHAKAILEAAQRSGKPVWIAFSVSDRDGTLLRSGEPLVDALAECAAADAILVNCSAPEAIPAALEILATSGKPYGAYANGFEMITEDFLGDKPTVDALSKRRDFTPELYADHAMAWVEQGATIIGGCCEVSPTHISQIASRLRAAGHEIV